MKDKKHKGNKEGRGNRPVVSLHQHTRNEYTRKHHSPFSFLPFFIIRFGLVTKLELVARCLQYLIQHSSFVPHSSHSSFPISSFLLLMSYVLFSSLINQDTNSRYVIALLWSDLFHITFLILVEPIFIPKKINSDPHNFINNLHKIQLKINSKVSSSSICLHMVPLLNNHRCFRLR